MVIGQEIDRIMRTYGRRLSSKQAKALLNQTIQLCENYSFACSKAIKLVPMHSIFMAVILDHEKQIQLLEQDCLELSVRQ
jgi:hypothetical protein